MPGNHLWQILQNPELLHSKEEGKNWNNPIGRAWTRTERKNTMEANMAQELSLYNPRREAVMKEESGGNNCKTLEGRGR